MVEQLDQRIHRIGNPLVIIDPADGFIDLSFHRDRDLETVSMHLAALVPLRKTRQGMSSFKTKFLGESCAHEISQSFLRSGSKSFQAGNPTQQHTETIAGFPDTQTVTQTKIDHRGKNDDQSERHRFGPPCP